MLIKFNQMIVFNMIEMINDKENQKLLILIKRL